MMHATDLINRRFEEPSEFKNFCKKLETPQRQDIINVAKRQGLTWNENEVFKVNWMRCAMAINKHLRKGKTFNVLIHPYFEEKTVTKEESKTSKKAKISTIENRNTNILAEKLNRKYREAENGNLIFGLGYEESPNKFGNMSCKPGHVKILFIDNVKQWGDGHWLLLESAFEDKDLIKNNLNGRFDMHGGKKWYVPFSQILDLLKVFENVEISHHVAPAVKGVFERVNIERIDPETMKYRKENYKYEKPEGMGDVTLFPHQERTVEFLLNNKRVTAGLAVGLGKTLSSITAAKELLNRKVIERILVIAPSSVKSNWKSEIEKFGNEKAIVINSSDLRKKTADEVWKEAEKSTFIIVNYDMIRKEETRNKLIELCPSAVIADEAHKLKNWKALQTKSFNNAWGKSEYVWFLTATPYPNGQPRETYTMLSHLVPNKVGKWWEFRDRFVECEEVWTGTKTVLNPVMLTNLPELKKLMDDVVIIRTHKSDDVISALPKDRHMTYQLEMTKDQDKLYKKLLDSAKDEAEELEEIGQITNFLAMLKRLEQVALDPDMMKDPKEVDMKKLYPKEEWAVNTILDHLEDQENRGVVVFCDMKLPLNKVKYNLVENGLKDSEVAFITGDVDSEERFQVTERFSRGEVKVVLCTSAAEEGVNLQHGSHTLIHLDVPWVPKAITQREGRILRQGQPNEYATFFTPVMTGTVEDNKRATLTGKIGTIEGLLGKNAAGSSYNNVKGDSNATKLSIKDIKEILKMDAHLK
jgi:SNF2 family DNA or RNA helicase